MYLAAKTSHSRLETTCHEGRSLTRARCKRECTHRTARQPSQDIHLYGKSEGDSPVVDTQEKKSEKSISWKMHHVMVEPLVMDKMENGNRFFSGWETNEK
jgi:hypothetical protein